MPDSQKIIFLRSQLASLFQQLDSNARGSWGVLNAQQMVEHFTDSVKNASGKLELPRVNTGEKMELSRAFMLSDQLFKENTKNPLMTEEAAPLRKPDMKSAVEKLQLEIDYFFHAFENNPELTTTNPFFGDLNFDQNIHLLHKHAMHHLRQFGVEAPIIH